ncbi:MAG: MOSC domain-containing protein [Acidimicrobiia bacterium]|nr:MOSC domain-containing protein [Acidimicrobiia bacterium]
MDAQLDHIRAAPADQGVLRLVAVRPEVDQRATPAETRLTLANGVEGDSWRGRGDRRTEDGSANVDKQLTLMNARVIEAIAGAPDAWPAAGDQLFVDLDLSHANLPAGSRLRIGEAVVEISAHPHNGCAKFARRYGEEAVRFVNSDEGKPLRLRGANARVVTEGTIRVGDEVEVLSRG